MPKGIQEAPVLTPGTEWIFQAFFDLNSCRGGMGDGQIPWWVIMQYAKHHGIEGDSLDFFHGLISTMDIAYLNHMAEKRNKTQMAARQKDVTEKAAIRQKHSPRPIAGKKRG